MKSTSTNQVISLILAIVLVWLRIDWGTTDWAHRVKDHDNINDNDYYDQLINNQLINDHDTKLSFQDWNGPNLSPFLSSVRNF